MGKVRQGRLAHVCPGEGGGVLGEEERQGRYLGLLYVHYVHEVWYYTPCRNQTLELLSLSLYLPSGQFWRGRFSPVNIPNIPTYGPVH